jgi:SAM-dependent methyltransferase
MKRQCRGSRYCKVAATTTKRLTIAHFAHRSLGCAEAVWQPRRTAPRSCRHVDRPLFPVAHLRPAPRLLGRLGGTVMARINGRARPRSRPYTDDVQPHDTVLDVGFGPGTAIQLLARSAQRVRGVNPPVEMLRQASARNASAIAAVRVELHEATADRLPFPDRCIDKAIAAGSMQVWPDAVAGLREIGLVLKPGGRLALAFS